MAAMRPKSAMLYAWRALMARCGAPCLSVAGSAVIRWGPVEYPRGEVLQGVADLAAHGLQSGGAGAQAVEAVNRSWLMFDAFH